MLGSTDLVTVGLKKVCPWSSRLSLLYPCQKQEMGVWQLSEGFGTARGSAQHMLAHGVCARANGYELGDAQAEKALEGIDC